VLAKARDIVIRILPGIAVALALTACDVAPAAPAGTQDTQATEATPSVAAVDPIEAAKAVQELESWDAIIEVMHDESLAAQWTIGVQDDGSKRYGLAESVCMELSDRGLIHDLTWVRVVDRQAVMSNGGDFRAASLGGIRCATGDWIDP
jgi:hypothetical protein